MRKSNTTTQFEGTTTGNKKLNKDARNQGTKYKNIIGNDNKSHGDALQHKQNGRDVKGMHRAFSPPPEARVAMGLLANKGTLGNVSKTMTIDQ